MVNDMTPPTRRVLFVCYGAGHVNMLVPLILKALSDPKLEVCVLGLTTAGAVLHRNGIPYIGFRALIEDGDEMALAYGEKLADSVPAGGNVPRGETVAYMGLSFYDLVSRHGIEEAQALYQSKGRQAFLPISILERLFDRIQPQLLVSTNSPRAERTAFMVARERKVPSVCIVGLFARHEVEWIGEPAFGSYVCVLSQSVKQFIHSAGRFDHEVVVTGNPALDRLARRSLANEAENFRLQNGWEGKKVILWASQPEPEKHPFTGANADPGLPRRVDQALLQVVECHPDWQLVIRYHPGETVDPADFPKHAYISTAQDDLAILLKSVDVVVTMTSTVGLEGVLLGKPLVTIDQSVFREDAPYSEMGLAIGVDDLNNLESALVDALSGSWQPREKLPEVGTSTDRIFKIMEELLH
jgi:hypothetical protein